MRPRLLVHLVVIIVSRFAVVVVQVGSGRERLPTEITVEGLLLLWRMLDLDVVFVLLLVVETSSAVFASEAERRTCHVDIIR